MPSANPIPIYFTDLPKNPITLFSQAKIPEGSTSYLEEILRSSVQQ